MSGEFGSGGRTYQLVRRWLPIIGAVWMVLMLAAGWMMSVSVRHSISDELTGTLQANLMAAETATRAYFSQLIAEADRLAAEDFAAEIASSGDLNIQHGEHVRAGMDGLLAWCVIGADNAVLASDVPGLLAERLAIPDAAIRRLELRQSTVTTPFLLPGSFDVPMMAAVAPIHDGGRRTGAAVWLVDPIERWSEELSKTRWGKTGQTFAIDREARMVSQGRFSEDDFGSVLTIDADGSASQTLTLMADQVTRGGTGIDVDGYVGARAADVIGVWTWIDDYDIGLASEMDVAEAREPLRRMWRWLAAMAALIVLPLLLPLVFWWLEKRGGPSRLSDDRGRLIGQYQLGETLGRGGMGTVYRGTHGMLRRTVAIKVLEGESVSQQAIARFEREAQMTAQLRHPNTIDLYDFGRTDQDAFFYVMEYVDGITMQDLVDDYGAQPPARVIHLLLQVCGSLSEAHHHGLIHRDIKPANLMVTSHPGASDLVKVLDFGLVKHVASDASANDLQLELTTSEGITGTPMYMSPETVRDAAMSNAASDIYSLGGVGYTLLTGMPMFDGEASADICMKQLKEDPVRPSDRLGRPLPMDLQNVLMSCLRKDPKDRPRSIDDLAAALRQCDDAGGWTDIDALRWWQVLQDDKATEKNPATTATKAGGLSTAT